VAIKITCDHCGSDEKIFTYTAIVKKSDRRYPDSENPKYLEEDYSEEPYTGPEFIQSMDLCRECYWEIKGNFYYIFAKEYKKK
jgi:hypothetical protein